MFHGLVTLDSRVTNLSEQLVRIELTSPTWKDGVMSHYTIAAWSRGAVRQQCVPFQLGMFCVGPTRVELVFPQIKSLLQRHILLKANF